MGREEKERGREGGVWEGRRGEGRGKREGVGREEGGWEERERKRERERDGIKKVNVPSAMPASNTLPCITPKSRRNSWPGSPCGVRARNMKSRV